MSPSPNRTGSGMAIRGAQETMLDTIFSLSELVFFVASLLYVKFCDGLR